jgi:aldehyde:ferredoxin oxidoreductase
MERAFSHLHGGYAREDDTLPERFFTDPVSGGPYQGAHLDRVRVEEMLDEYYAALGWDIQTGLPSDDLLRRLELVFLLRPERRYPARFSETS